MRLTNETPSEKALRLFVNIFVPAVALLVVAFLWFIPQPCDIDAIYPWCWTHPANIADYIGTVMFCAGAFVLSGIWLYWLKDEYDERQYPVAPAGWICAIVGMLMVVLF